MLTAVHQASTFQANTAPQPRLVRAAHEFEAQLMKELLKPLTAGSGLGASEDDTGSAGAMDEYAGEALGRGLSDRGGFGIADRMIAQLSQSGNRTASVPVTANRHSNNGPEPAR